MKLTRLLRKKSYGWTAFGIAMFGAVVSSVGIIVVAVSHVEPTVDNWVGITAGYLLFATFLPLGVISFVVRELTEEPQKTE